MLCMKCEEEPKVAIAMQKMMFAWYRPSGKSHDFCYIPVCEEHKSDSTEIDMVIPLPGLIDLPLCAAYKRITELELGLELEQLKNQKCTCPICWAKRTGYKPPISGECSTNRRKDELLDKLASLPSIELRCQCPECVDMRENHGQTRLQLREEITLLNKRLSESRESLEASETIREELDIETVQGRKTIGKLEHEQGILLAFIRQYFKYTSLPVIGEVYPVGELSYSKLVELVELINSLQIAKEEEGKLEEKWTEFVQLKNNKE